MINKNTLEGVNLLIFSIIFFAILNIFNSFFIVDGFTYLLLLIVFLLFMLYIKKRYSYIDVFNIK